MALNPADYEAALKQRAAQTRLLAAASRTRSRARAQGRPGASTAPPSGMVRIWNDLGAVTAILMTDVEFSDGVGGWQDEARVDLPEVPIFGGRTRDSAPLSLRLQRGITTDAALEPQVQLLRAFGRPRTDGSPPAPVYLLGELPFGPADPMRIDGMTRGKRRVDAGKLRLLEFTLSLSEWVDPALVPQGTPRSTRTSTNVRRSYPITTAQGDTMRGIAVRELGLATRWTELRSWNPKLAKVDPDALLRPGTKLVIK